MIELKKNFASKLIDPVQGSEPAQLKEVSREDICAQFLQKKGSKLTVRHIIDEHQVKFPPLEAHFCCSICLSVVF